MKRKHLNFLLALYAMFLLQACNSDEPKAPQDKLPNICFAKTGGLYINGVEGTVIDGVSWIYSLGVKDGQLYVYGVNSYGKYIIWHDGESQVLDISSDLYIDAKSPYIDNGNAYFRAWSQSREYYSIMGFPNGKVFQLPKVVGAVPQCCVVHGDEYFACANVAEPVHLNVQNGAYVWVNGDVIRLSDNLSVNLWAINGLHGHYYVIGPYDIYLDEFGHQAWSHMGYWRDGQRQELDKRDAINARPYFIHMHGDTPIVYGFLLYDNYEHRACVWVDGNYIDLSQGRYSDVKGVRTCGKDWYAFVYDADNKTFYVWRNGELFDSYLISDIVDFTVY